MKKIATFGLIALTLLVTTKVFAADTLHFVIMSAADPKKEGPKYEALARYLKANTALIGDIQLRVGKSYFDATQLFQSGEVEGMFSGSFVGAVLIKKGIAKPVARPLSPSGISTYKALVVTREGAKPFAGLADFKGKRVAFAGLASAGEIFVRALLPAGARLEQYLTPLVTPSHQATLNALQNGAADYAVVKNTLWNPEQYKGFAVVGVDSGENPDGTLLLTNAAFEKYGADLGRVLAGIEADKSEAAEAVRKAFGAKSFIPTAAKDFEHTLGLLDKAHIDAKTFDFTF